MRTKIKQDRTVLDIVSVSVHTSKSDGHSDMLAFKVLQDIGFVGLKYEKDRTMAHAQQNTRFFLVYDSTQANRKNFQMVRRNSAGWNEVETGYTMYIQPEPNTDGTTTIYLRGNQILDWNLVCRNVDAKTAGEYKIAAARGKILDTKPNGEIQAPIVSEEEHTVIPPPTPKKLVGDNLLGLPIVQPITAPVLPQVKTTTPPAPAPLSNKGEQVLHIPLGEIICFQRQTNDPSFSGQPRKEFDEVELNKLAQSIKQHGQKVPALVCRNGDKWELIAGERRWRALKLNGFPYIRAIEEKPQDKKAQHLLALLENLFRVDPSPLEISNALQEQIEAGETQMALAKATNLSLTHVRHLLAVQAIHPELKSLLSPSTPEENRIRLLEAAILSSIDPAHQVEIWNQAKKEPTHKLIVAKLHELGKPFIQYKRKKRDSRREESCEIAKRLNRRLNNLSLAVTELEAVTAEEWRQSIVLRGATEASSNITLLTKAINIIGGVKQRISRAKVAAKSSTQ